MAPCLSFTMKRGRQIGEALRGTQGAGRGIVNNTGGMRAARVRTFGDARPGELVVFVDSAGRVAVAVNGGRAVVALGVTPGDVLRVAQRPS